MSLKILLLELCVFGVHRIEHYSKIFLFQCTNDCHVHAFFLLAFFSSLQTQPCAMHMAPIQRHTRFSQSL